jgi:hypothetical protein
LEWNSLGQLLNSLNTGRNAYGRNWNSNCSIRFWGTTIPGLFSSNRIMEWNKLDSNPTNLNTARLFRRFWITNSRYLLLEDLLDLLLIQK